MRTGRPTLYKRKYCKIASDFLSQGYSKEALVGELGISRQCLYEWIAKYEDFGYTVKVAEAKVQLVWEELGLRAAQGQVKNFNTSVWMFVMKNRFGWKDKQDITSGEKPIMNIGVVSYADALQVIEEKKLQKTV